MTRRPAKAAPPSWSGHLIRSPHGIKGELADTTGWRLDLTAIASKAAVPAKLYVRGDVAATGAETPDRATLADYRLLAGELVADGTAWKGELVIREMAILLTAALTAPGHLALQGIG